jgi:hypothetical protein
MDASGQSHASAALPLEKIRVTQLNMKVVGRHSLSESFKKHKNYLPFLGIGPIVLQRADQSSLSIPVFLNRRAAARYRARALASIIPGRER